MRTVLVFYACIDRYAILGERLMHRFPLYTGIAALLLLAFVLPAMAAGADTRVLFSFESNEEMANIKATGARLERVQAGATDGSYALEVTLTGEKPELTLSSGAQPWDWKPFGAVALDVSNEEDTPVAFTIEVKDAAGGATKGDVRLRAKGTMAVALPLNSPDPLELGMRGPAAIPGYRLASSDHHKIELSSAGAISITFRGAAKPRKVRIDAVRLIPGISYQKIVDQLGQFAFANWPGKLKSEADFVARRAEEKASIATRPVAPERDEYGGWAAGPAVKATGFFHAEKRNGKWWLVTPSGHLFLSFGVNSVITAEGDTITEGRETMFQWLPAKGEPLAAHYRENRDWEALGLKIKFNMGQSFNFYSANLERKYGAGWYEAWKEAAVARLRAWGYNTIGNWSDPQLYDMHKMPYTATIDPWPAASEDHKSPYAEVPSGNDYWKLMADPFDPRFAAAIDAVIREPAQKLRDDPWCLGYFIDNEMSWGSMKDDKSRYGLALGALGLTQKSPAKRAFVASLEKEYGDVAKLNEAWSAKVASWKELLESPFHTAVMNAAMKEDLRLFSKQFARKYFETVSGILKKYDPNHMYLGPRFAGHTRESVEECGELCDVVTFNIYRPKVVPSDWKVLDGIDRPVLIGEFHMGALDRGMFHTGLVATENQEDRARMYQEYIRSVVDHPLMVGCHYFKYADEPLTGRPGDGENYNIGLVSVTDTPYPELIEAAKKVQEEAYGRRAK